MSGPLTGAVILERCKWCEAPVTPCLCGGRCIGLRFVHLMSRKHKCGNGVTWAYARTEAQA